VGLFGWEDRSLTLFQAALLGLVQGLTEFLPVSSTAHVRLVPELFGWPDPGAPFTAAIQLGTLVAIVAYFWKDLVRSLGGWASSFFDPSRRNSPEARMGWAVVWGTFPIVVFGILFRHEIETGLRSLYVVAWSLIGIGLVMAGAEWMGKRTRQLNDVRPKDGFAVGLFQALALIPGVSRSGSTISGALFLGFERADAARFSFLLSVPSILAAGVFSLWRHREVLLGPEQAAVWTANAASFVSGYLAIALLLRMLKKHGIGVFVGYRLLVGIAVLVALQAGWLDA
jgi:undecaprenyl-diphosphatase